MVAYRRERSSPVVWQGSSSSSRKIGAQYTGNAEELQRCSCCAATLTDRVCRIPESKIRVISSYDIVCRRLRLSQADAVGLGIDVIEQIRRFHLIKTHVGHRKIIVFGEQRQGNWVALFDHLVRSP